MKQHLLKRAIAVAALTTSLAAVASPTLIITDGVTTVGPLTTVTGTVTYANSFDASWNVVITTGTTKPLFGSAVSPNMEISILASATGSTPVPPLVVVFSDTDFGPTTGSFSALLTGHDTVGSAAPVSFDTYYDAGNGVGILSSPLSTSGLVAGPNYNSFLQGASVAASLYSLTEVVTIHGVPGENYSLDCNLQSLSVDCAGGSGQVGTPYASALVVSGGVACTVGTTACYTFALVSGTLPPGLTLNTCTGALTGTPTQAGTFHYVVQVTDCVGRTANTSALNCGITIAPPPAMPVVSGDTATIGFWHNKNGQALIDSFNGGPTSTLCGTWLATNYGCLFSGLNGKPNSVVAAQFMTYFNVKGQKTYAQVMAGALACYATDSTLAGGSQAGGYGFTVSSAGTGAKTYNVGMNGSALGLLNNTTYTVAQLLQAANANCSGGTITPGAFNALNNIFDGINQSGDIN